MKWLIFLLILLLPINVMALVDSNATTETKALYTQLQNAQGNYIYFGQQNPRHYWDSGTFYDNSNLITGKLPFVFGRDYNFITAYSDDYMKLHYRNGGIITMSWHMKNWVTNGNYQDKTGNPVTNILPGGSARTTYLTALDGFANWCNNFKDDDGNLIPIIFRPFHENDGNWFWWGIDTCTDAQFIQLWRDIVIYLRDTKEVHNLLYCYSPEILNGYTYDGALYPGDNYVDIFGIDRYSGSTTTDISTIITAYGDAYDASVIHNKVFAITEGLRSLTDYPKSDFWTWWINQILNDSKAKYASWILCWHSPNWGPVSGRSDADDFLAMSQNSSIRFLTYQDTITDKNNIGINFYVNDDNNNLNVYNDTFIGNGIDEGIHLDTGFSTKTATFKNNIVKTSGQPSIDVPSGTTLDYNCYYDTTGTYSFIYGGVTYNSLTSYQLATSQDLHSISADPLLTPEYKLKKGSPCIDAGVAVSGVTDDYDGWKRPIGSAPDMGAYEYRSKRFWNFNWVELWTYRRHRRCYLFRHLGYRRG